MSAKSLTNIKFVVTGMSNNLVQINYKINIEVMPFVVNHYFTMIIQLLLRLRMELSTPSAITEITFQYLLELEWNFWNRRRITFD